MYIVKILLPTADNEGRAFQHAVLTGIRDTLIDRFGGVTTFSRAPADGIWSTGERLAHDEIVVVEVMAETLDYLWWRGFRKQLEATLRQESIVIRASESERL